MNTIPEDYWEFYKMFHADSTYQLTHIVFPLEGLPADTEKKANESAYHWQKDDWILHKTFDYDQSFEREFRYFNGIVLEQIRNSTNHFLMERRFTKIQGEWHLIYYAAMRQVKNF